MSRYPADSQAPAVIVLTRFLLVTLILGTLARLATKWWKFGAFFRDDYYSLVAMLASVAQAVAISIAVDKGYGTHIAQLSDGQVAEILKAQYTSNFFYIVGIAFSQLSFLVFVQQLAHHGRRAFNAVQIIIALWTISSIFASAFQCRPRQWDYIHDRCFDREAWFICLSISNVVTEVAIIAQTVHIMVKVQTTWERKLNLMAVFLFRVLVPAALVAQGILTHYNINTPDPTSATWSITVCTQIALCLSVVTASTPQFVPVLRHLQSTGMRLDGMTRYHTSTYAQYSRSRSKYALSGARRTADRSTHTHDQEHELANMPLTTTKTTITGAIEQNRGGSWDEGSQSSQTGIIRETRTWVVTEEHVQA
ncbi:uncharacterized protein BJX67DRAFT_371877 [Aspergillus lucknowensis]|uniref:Rhodopsin domain-containing protein n=1 Tax=Aspergillus lucknowensis TaxID=176173 RepID=A0ABR4LSL3_9EURO